ncbi:MAG: phosphonate C-P lyase system protein PhnH [Alphaproteobacteria bacterium]|nr:phosphonate C-P lyase system protein PhnH [Alphaproteobacteria bacterium]
MIGLDLPGFADPVTGAQATFRAVLDAMARPGRICEAGTDLAPPAPLGRAAAAALLALVDHDTPLFIAADYARAREWIAFHSGAPIVADLGDCAFAIARAMPDLSLIPVGSYAAPEQSATLILDIASLCRGTRYRLSGPGLRSPTMFAADGLPERFIELWSDNRRQFPCGVDLILCADGALAALPRSVIIEHG